MGRIRILSDAAANKIAAGEVVERPASVVKELLENSLDAGSTDIRIALESAGRRLIRIADNGWGMLRDDALLAFERHATSKLNSVDDLLSISTFGFRGEALPSIAAVSRLLLETRSQEETTGTAVEIAGGKVVRCEEAALAAGTVITIRDLFYNMPARRKFLRSEQTELSHVATLVTHYSLANADKSFELRHGPTELLSVSPASSLRDRVYQVFGSEVLEELVEISFSERSLHLAAMPDEEGTGDRVFGLRGFVSRPQVQKANRNSICLFVNGRLIKDKLLLHAISAAYHNLMPPGSYPFAILFLDCDCEEVDVNVHPSKTEVRFRHGSFVHDFVRDTIRETLMISRPAASITIPTRQQPAAEIPYSEWSQKIETSHQPQSFEPQPAFTQGDESDLPVMRVRSSSPPPQRFDFESTAQGEPPPRRQSLEPEPSTFRLPVPDTHTGFPADLEVSGPASMTELADLRPLGQLHNSFIVAAARDGLWIIDQHVAHERILFEKVLHQQQGSGVESQQLLMPVVIQLTAGQQIQYARIAEELNASGFSSEPFGHRTVAITSVPSDVPLAAVETLVSEILELGAADMRAVSVSDIRRGIAASIACRAAIKVNMRLDPAKIEWMLGALGKTEYPMACPHGRPVALRYATRDILKAFHRI